MTMTDADHLTAAAEHMAAADRALVGKRPDPARAAHYATVAGGHYLAALCTGHRPPLPEPDHHDVYAEDQPDPHRRIEAERDQLAAQVAELNTRLDDVIGRTQCDRAALARVRRLVDIWADNIPANLIVAFREALNEPQDDTEPAAEASR